MLADATPSALLTAFEDAAAGLGLAAAGTAVLARLSPGSRAHGVVADAWTNAGHPPPVVISPRAPSRVLDAHDAMFGFAALRGLPRHDHSADLPPGTTVLLYTDGLVERSGQDIDTGIAALCTSCSPSSPIGHPASWSTPSSTASARDRPTTSSPSPSASSPRTRIAPGARGAGLRALRGPRRRRRRPRRAPRGCPQDRRRVRGGDRRPAVVVEHLAAVDGQPELLPQHGLGGRGAEQAQRRRPDRVELAGQPRTARAHLVTVGVLWSAAAPAARSGSA
jgi:hypothetical protein